MSIGVRGLLGRCCCCLEARSWTGHISGVAGAEDDAEVPKEDEVVPPEVAAAYRAPAGWGTTTKLGRRGEGGGDRYLGRAWPKVKWAEGDWALDEVDETRRSEMASEAVWT